MRKFTTKDLTLAAMVAALYAVMSYFGNVFGLTYGPIQLRFSEALCVLPFLFPATAPGLFVGCLAANLLSPYGPLDIVVGSLATLIAAVWTSRVKRRWLAPLPPVVCNALIVGFEVAWSEVGFTAALLPAYALNMLTVGLGELCACYLLGLPLLSALSRVPLVQQLAPEDRLARLS